MWRSERTEWNDWVASSSEEPEATRRPDRRSRNPWEVAMTTPGENTPGKTGKKSTVLNPERELEDLTHMGTSIVSSRNGSNPPSGPEEQEKPTPRVRQRISDWAQHERSEWDTTVQERGTDHQLLTHQTTLPQGRETNGKQGPGSRAILRHHPQAQPPALAARPEPEASTPGMS